MAAVVTFPNPCLVAVLLVCQTRAGSGSQILFRYPSHPLSGTDPRPDRSAEFEAANVDSSTDSEVSAFGEDDLFALPNNFNRSNLQVLSGRGKVTGEEEERGIGPTPSQPNTSRKQNDESLFGIAEDGLVSLLAPDRTWHKRRYELSINELTFVGRPVFVRTDGTWRRHRPRKQSAPNPDTSASDTATDNDEAHEDREARKIVDSADDHGVSGAKSPLTMFHVVFVMNPPPLEYHVRVKDMYDHVIKKFSRALRWEQAHNNYVWKEIEAISAVKASPMSKRLSQSALCAEIVAQSSLANAISNIYSSISSSRIATVNLSPKISFSLQIPPVTSTSYLPSLTEPPIQPGLWLTTATDIGSTGTEAEGSEPGGPSQMARHFTLLLKSPPHRIAKDAMEAGGQLALHLPKFVSSLRPTKSFYKLSIASHTSLTDIQVLAHHLIYWRRAVAIPPLHQKDVYIVSPNADMRKLREATKNYDQQFAPTMPNMPSLPKILSALSGIPRPFGSLIPSNDHKEKYYLALAWLLRNGWVTQLRTFVYVRVDSDVKRAVRESDRESKSRTLVRHRSHRDDMGLEREAVRPRKRPSIVSRPSSDGRRSTDGNWPKHNPRMASLILNPPRASPEESQWLEHIESSLTTDHDALFSLSADERMEVQKYWPLFVKYFNGHVAIETIPVREGLKRRFIWTMLNKLGLSFGRGVEDVNGTNKAILVAVRHW